MSGCSDDQVRGPLAGCAAGFAAELGRLGYSRTGARQQLGLLADLSGWLDAEGLAPAELAAGQVARFLGWRCHRGLRSGVGAALVLGYLAGLGVIPEQAGMPAAGPCAAALEGYRRYLASERGLTGPEVTRRVQTAGMFAEHARAAERGWAAVTAADVTGFAVAQCAALGRASACKRISQLRSFLRFAHLSGLTAAALASAVPSAAWWSASSLPRWLPPGQVAALLAACDQRTARGRRDFAIVTLLSRLGLRAGEVAAMQLGDIDWRAGTLTVRGKARREEKMPLPADAGEAVASYLADGRPAAGSRSVFLRSLAPRHGLSAAGVSNIVAAAAGRAGLPPVGAHRLRHSAATAMLRAGASLDEVGQVLRHRSAATTAIYAKVDHAALAAVGQAVAGRHGMSGLHDALDGYLAVRRALGHRLTGAEYLLRQFVDWLDQAGAATITTDLALAWALQPAASAVYHAQRMSAVRGFASWLHSSDPQAQVPPAGLLPARPARPLPYLYRPEEITAIMDATGRLRLHPASRHAYPALVGLLASTGLRVSEAISLQRGDVMTGECLVRVTRSKFGKSREVPLHPSAAAALEEYARRRDELFPHPQAGAFLLGPAGSPLAYTTVLSAFRRLLDLAGVHAGPGQPRPGIHSLRHTFAVATLTGWYRDGADVPALLPLLSTYMGHADPRSTYYYLQACPELLALAAARLPDLAGEAS